MNLRTEKIMKIICCLVCILLLSSCVYYGVQRNFEIGNDSKKSACNTGSIKDKEKCRADLKRLNESIEAQKSI
jgi:hypothetical protein